MNKESNWSQSTNEGWLSYPMSIPLHSTYSLTGQTEGMSGETSRNI